MCSMRASIATAPASPLPRRRRRAPSACSPPPALPAASQFVMFGAQAALVRWRKEHRRSYDLATLVGLWLIPPIISVQLGAWALRRPPALSARLHAFLPPTPPPPAVLFDFCSAAACWRFFLCWLLYSSVTGYYLYRCSSKKLEKTLPKLVGWAGGRAAGWGVAMQRKAAAGLTASPCPHSTCLSPCVPLTILLSCSHPPTPPPRRCMLGS